MNFGTARSVKHVVTSVMISSVSVPGFAQSSEPPAHTVAQDLAEQADENTIVVTANTGNYQSQRGAAQTDIAPEQQLSPADIRAYGVNSLTDLLTELAPQTRSDRGRGGEGPVTLLNGRRISGFAEIRDIPTEAIERVDILPEEVALKYGYSASQRIVNIVLRRRFRSITGELEGTTATRGGGNVGQVEAGLLRIRQGNRFNFNLEGNSSAAITEADRNLISRSGGRAFDYAGNIVGATNGGQVDPALSALAGMPVTSAGVPANAATARPALADFVATANKPNSSDVSRYRTIRAATKTLSANSVYATTILGDVGATINATLDVNDSDSLRGLAGTSLALPAGSPFSPFSQNVTLLRYPDRDPLKQSVEGVAGHIGFTFNKDIGKWRNSLTGGYDHSDTRTRTERGIDVNALQARLIAGDATLNPFGTIPASLLGTRLVDRANANSDIGTIQIVSAGPLFKLPAGPLSASIKVGAETNSFDVSSTRSGVAASSDLSRETLSGRLSLDLPIASTREDVLAAIGNLSVNVNVAGDRISDFGTLGSYGYGANWTPRKGISLIASVTEDRSAPTVQQLGNPLVLTPDVRTFDYVRGTTVDIVQLGGGNTNLDADHRRVTKLGATIKPFPTTDLSFTANYIRSAIRDAIAGFPEPTVAIEAAFPDRFTRDASGNLTRIDARAINFERQERSELRWGFTFSKSIKSDNSKLMAAIRETPRFKEFQAQREKEQAARAALQAQGGGQPGVQGQPGGQQGGQRDGSGPGGFGGPGGGGGSRGPGGFGGGPGGQNGGRLQFALYHTWHFKDEVLIRKGLPVLDLLNGDTIGSSGGTAEHELEAQFGYSNNGIGARLTGNWQSATTVNAGPSSPTGNLRFDDRTTANLRLFINLGQQASLVKYWWAQGARVSLSVNNLFDSRQRVTDATGATPLRYQAGYLDPTGRTIRISFRKLFF